MNRSEGPALAARAWGARPTVTRAALREWVRSIETKHLVYGVAIAILAYQVLVPLVILVWGSLSTGRPGAPDYFSLASLSLDNYVRAFGSRHLYVALGNTVVFAGGVTILACALGGALAWIVERTNTPFRNLITLLCIARLIVPGILGTVAWIFLASPQIGMLNTLAQQVFGLPGPPFDVYSMAGMIWVEAMDMLPVAFLLMSAALRSMDPSLEEASLTAGKGLAYTTTHVTFPLILPAALATLILMFIRGIETFEVPLLLGVPARTFTFVVEIWLNTRTKPADYGLAGAYAVFVLVICVGLVWLYNRATRHSETFAVITGKAFRPRRVDLGPWRWAACAFALLVMTASVLLPLAVLAWASFMPRYVPIGLDGLSQATLANYAYVLSYPLTLRAFLNSSFLGVTAATATVFLIAIIAWLVIKTRVPGRQYLDHLAFAPIAIPAAVMGVAFLWFYLSVPLPIYGTIWILFLLYVTRYMPVVMRILSAAMVQIGNDLHEASEISGASWWRGFRTVTLPLLRPGLVAAWIWVLIHAFRELSGSIFVYASGTEPIGVAAYNLWENGSYVVLAAFGMLVFLTLIVLSVIAQTVGSRFGIRGA